MEQRIKILVARQRGVELHDPMFEHVEQLARGELAEVHAVLRVLEVQNGIVGQPINVTIFYGDHTKPLFAGWPK